MPEPSNDPPAGDDAARSAAEERRPLPGAPLNLAQAGILASHMQDPSSAGMTISVVATVRPAVDPDLFAEATRRMAAELDGVRVVVASIEGEWRQWVGGHTVDLTVHDVGDADDPALAADRLVADIAATPLALDGRTPLVEFHLVHVGPEESRWLVVAHHLVCDGYSGVIMRQRTADWYTHLRGEGPPPEPVTGSVEDAWAVAGGGRTPDTAQRWAEDLAELPERLTLAEREGRTESVTTRTPVSVSAEDAAALAEAGGHGSWIYPAVAVVAAYTARCLEQPRVVLGFVVSGRRHRAERGVVSSLARIVPLVLDVPHDATVRSLSVVARRRVARAGSLGPVAAEELRKILPAAWRMGRIFGPITNLLPFDTEIVVPGHELRSLVLSRGPVEDLQLAIGPDGPGGAGLLVDGVANAHAYDDGQAPRHVARLARLMALAGASPGTPLRSLDPSLPEERAVIEAFEQRTGQRIVDGEGERALVGMPGRLVGRDGRPTGSLAVLHDDGRLEDLGPLDRTCIVNGHAVHLERVRRAALEVTGVEDCSVSRSGRRLGVVVRPGPGLDHADLKAAVQARVRDVVPLLVGARVTIEG